MGFGMQFFPNVKPDEKSAAQCLDEALRLVDWYDVYGYSHVRPVEHYFHKYENVTSLPRSTRPRGRTPTGTSGGRPLPPRYC